MACALAAGHAEGAGQQRGPWELRGAHGLHTFLPLGTLRCGLCHLSGRGDNRDLGCAPVGTAVLSPRCKRRGPSRGGGPGSGSPLASGTRGKGERRARPARTQLPRPGEWTGDAHTLCPLSTPSQAPPGDRTRDGSVQPGQHGRLSAPPSRPLLKPGALGASATSPAQPTLRALSPPAARTQLWVRA